jgi:hypothetical protein
MTQDSKPTSNDDNARFEQLFEELTSDFGAACEKHNVNTAIAIAVHPESKHPIVLTRGHKYDVAIVLARMLKSLKMDMAEELNTDYEMDYSNTD